MEIDWLKSKHTFSFGDYFNPAATQYRALRVINEDWIAPGTGFPQHGHRDMEIVTWVLEGSLDHKDTLGNKATIEPGRIQRMSAGKGIEHSEWNSSKSTTHLLQIWIRPNRSGLAPTYDEKIVDKSIAKREWLEVAAPVEGKNTVRIHQDARILYGELSQRENRPFELEANRGVWVHVIGGDVTVDGTTMSTGDGLGIDAPADAGRKITFDCKTDSRILLFDLP